MALAALGATALVAAPGTAADPVKAEDVKDADAKLKLRLAAKRWLHIAGFATLDDLTRFVDAPPAQAAGEVVVIPVAGKFDAMIYI